VVDDPRRRSVMLYRRDKAGSTVSATPQLALPITQEDTGEVRLYRITLPFLPPSKNVIDNWPREWKSSAKAKWVGRIRAEVDAVDMPRGIGKVGLSAMLVFPSRNRRDPQNYAQCLWHWVPDALVTAGVLVDDDEGRVQIGRNWGLKFGYDLRPGVAKKYRERTILAITMKVPH
jgi:hypothetical protein